VDDSLVPDDLQGLTTGVQIATLGVGDQLLGERPQSLGLGLGRGDLAVFEQRLREVAQDQTLVLRGSAEAGSLRGSWHVMSL